MSYALARAPGSQASAAPAAPLSASQKATQLRKAQQRYRSMVIFAKMLGLTWNVQIIFDPSVSTACTDKKTIQLRPCSIGDEEDAIDALGQVCGILKHNGATLVLHQLGICHRLFDDGTARRQIAAQHSNAAYRSERFFNWWNDGVVNDARLVDGVFEGLAGDRHAVAVQVAAVEHRDRQQVHEQPVDGLEALRDAVADLRRQLKVIVPESANIDRSSLISSPSKPISSRMKRITVGERVATRSASSAV